MHKEIKKKQLPLDQGLELSNSMYMCVYVCMCVCMNMHAGCECNVVIATCPQRDLESTFLRCDNVAFTTLPQPKHNVVTTLSQRDFVCWEAIACVIPLQSIENNTRLKNKLHLYCFREVDHFMQ